ncbi:deoxyguanosinetriphosphate triphosphohydrolase [Solemya pervernicosa gill symbiont]|uniref:Deoxyguanosinetriphosphate triphosphohydrolase-like protein n=2 Tax=Gammaproteobacteria incertae sedis TaxID=118884 RepID=A0A1T2LB04_9GAMM|nr:deoxyguanosinetriphosphate triphosphohydrolase [Candidatus Reidiella endopervernicosa]OOZ42288.1 deoxyguanosinetriphosphate triphosphohydrolase [Solemya pervernicosa gill symbiont]QKQ25685.1 deoxyguanosinetriphosphate triphosphohydrolase [Candidatus Reidiella endopervernicosa]
MQKLAAYATNDSNTLGRRHYEEAPQCRGEFQRDRDRIIHSTAFRRLEYKTQVFVNHEGDHYRTRLTHSIEVAQISRSIARVMQLNEDLAEAIALAHDLGHTPFGHAGQDALNECMQNFGGFEHNLQSLRVVDQLEDRYADFRGLNLCFETREGILKHCSLENARTLGDVAVRFINKQQPSLEAQLTNLADEIAYNSHDVDDGLRSGLITMESLCEIELFREQYDEVKQQHPGLSERRTIHEIVRRLINRQVLDLIQTGKDSLEQSNPASLDDVRSQKQATIRFSDEMVEKNRDLKRFLRQGLYRHFRVHRMSAKAHTIISSLFEAFFSDTRLLPDEQQQNAAELLQTEGDAGRARAVADYIAGMTDRYAIVEYERIFNPSHLT